MGITRFLRALALLAESGQEAANGSKIYFVYINAQGSVQEYQRVMKAMVVKKLWFASIGGFINAKTMVDGLKRAGCAREMLRSPHPRL